MTLIDLEEIESVSEAHCTLAKGLEVLPNGDVSVKVYGVPYGGPKYLKGRDIQKEQFTEDTIIGDLPVVFTKFSHGKHPLFGKDSIGQGHRRADLDDANGRVYEIILDQRHRYFKALEALARDNLLGASSVPLQQTAEKSVDGTWTRWEVTEVTLTPWNVNPDAAIIFEKAMQDLGDTMANTPETPNVAAPEATPETPAAPAEQSLLDQVNQQAADAAADLEKSLRVETPAASASDALLKQVLEKITALEGRYAAQEKSIVDIKAVIPTLAPTTAKLVNAYIGKQPEEIAAIAALGKSFTPPPAPAAKPNTPQAGQGKPQPRTKLPPGAPGLN